MHWQKDKDAAAVDAARSFHPGGLVMPLVLDDDWLARHRTAYAAIGYTGIMFTPRDHLRFRSAAIEDAIERTLIDGRRRKPNAGVAAVATVDARTATRRHVDRRVDDKAAKTAGSGD